MSFGEGDYWDVRGTEPHPTKSAILGILSASLGLDWTNQSHANEIVDLGQNISVSSREDKTCSILRDYHTILNTLRANGKSNENAVQSYRNYLMDGAFTVLISCDPDRNRRIKSALVSPAWPVFLGRKACTPSIPLFQNEEADEENAKAAFEKIETIPQLKARKLGIKIQKKQTKMKLGCMTEELLDGNLKKTLIRDTVIHPGLRVFAQRQTYKFFVEAPYVSV